MKRLLKLLSISLWILAMTFSSGQAQCDGNYLTASGNKLYDAQGNVVRLTGINWFGFETANKAPHGLWTRDCKSMLIQIKDLGFNAIRIPWSNGILEPGATMSGISTAPVPDAYTGRTLNVVEGTLTKPLDLLDLIVDYCQELNLKIILDNHSRQPDGYLSEELWYTDITPNDKWISDWVFLADRYKDKDAVIGMDLNNEPHGKNGGGSRWGSGDVTNDWRLAAEACGDAILQVNPNVLIMVEGVEEFENETYWWGGNLKGADQYPVRLSDPSKLVYSPHEYGPTVFNQTWFSDPTFPDNMAGIWEDNFNYLHTQNVSPMFAGEFGIKFQGGVDEVWFDTYLDFMGQKGYSWTFWSWNPNSGDTGGILTDDWSTINDWKMNKLIPHLDPEIPNGTGAGCGNTFTITASTGTGGSITPNGSVTVPEGTDRTFNVSASSGFIISDVVVDGSSVGAVATYTFTNVQTDHSINALFTGNGNNNPIAVVTASVLEGEAPLAVSFDASSSTDEDGDNLSFNWNFGDGSPGSGSNISHTYTSAGQFIATVTVTDGNGGSDIASVAITVNASPLGCNFGTPVATALSSGNTSYNNIHVLGTGGPDLSNVTNFVINWDLQNNGLWQFSMNTNNGIPNWYTDLRSSATHTFSSAQPDISLSGTGFNGLDGDYYVNFVGEDFAMVSKTGGFVVYFSNSATPPNCTTNTVGRQGTPDPKVRFEWSADNRLILTDYDEIRSVTLINLSGQKLENGVSLDRGEIILNESLPNGIYLVRVNREQSTDVIKVLKKD